MTRLLVVDTETGGTDPQEHSILSVGAIVWEDGKLGDREEIFVAEPLLAVTARALEINRIDIVEHCKQAVAPKEAVQRLQSFLRKNFAEELEAQAKISLAGHNVNFDVGFLKRLYKLGGSRFEDVFSHRVMDTAGLVRFLHLAGRLSLSGASSAEAFKYFGIEVPEERRHTALGDATATALLLTKLIDIMRSPSVEDA